MGSFIAPGLPPDVDDTAQCIVCLTKLGRDASPERMIETFEAQTHFRTYASERNPSFTANCNVLSALLAQSEASQYSDQILKIVEFLCNCWWESDGYIKDKWVSRMKCPELCLDIELWEAKVCPESESSLCITPRGSVNHGPSYPNRQR